MENYLRCIISVCTFNNFLFQTCLSIFAEILVAKYVFYSPWRPKRSQLGALVCYGALSRNLEQRKRL